MEVGVKSVREEFEPYWVEIEMVMGEGRCCRKHEGRVERAEKSREEMGSMRGRGALLAGWLAVWVK